MKPTPLPDPIQEGQVKIELTWKADERTTKAIKRQAKIMGVTPTDYLKQAIACVLYSNEETTFVTPEGEFIALSGEEFLKWTASQCL